MRRAYHIAKADFLQRMRSRKLVIILAIVAFLGYLVNVGQIELAYQVDRGGDLVTLHGTNTAAFVGLKAGLTGATILWLAGFYLMNATLERDRRNGIDRLIASTTVSDRTYLVGKWLSNLGLGLVILAVLGVATILNHLVHGVGPTEPLAVAGPIVVFAVPVGALVGAIAVGFESVDWLDGTGGNIAYFLLAVFALAGVAAAQGRMPQSVPLWLKAIDPLGQLAVYELTVDAVLTAVPTYVGGPPSFGILNVDSSFTYTGHRWPAWIFIQRLWLVIPTAVILGVATLPVEQFGSGTPSGGGRLRSRITALRSRFGKERQADDPTLDPAPIETLSLTSVENRQAGSFWRLLAAEVRLTVRGRPWWWYAGAVGIGLVPIGSLLPAGLQTAAPDITRRLFLPLVFIWPLFLWSDIGTRTARHQMTDVVYSSGHAVEQLVAEWLSGVFVGLGLSVGLVVLFVGTNQAAGLLGIASGVLFAPSLAVAIGMWSGSSELFEMTYLLVWYAGPLNGGEPVDFVGATVESAQIGVPIVFIALSVLLLAVGLYRRKLAIG